MGFLCEACEYLRKQNPKRTTAQDHALQESTFYGKEKKSLAYVIGVPGFNFGGRRLTALDHLDVEIG